MQSQHSFANVPRSRLPRSSFDLSHTVKLTFDADYLVPVLALDITPGTTINCTMRFFARLATPIRPLLDNLYLESQFFFVPYRQVWVNFEKFHGAQDNPGDSIDFTIPKLATGLGAAWTVGGIHDCFGLPPGITNLTTQNAISALPFRAYVHIYDTWYRDQNMQGDKAHQTSDGPDATSFTLYKRGKRKDYFTSCLAAPQRGTAPTISLGTTAPVIPATPQVAPTFEKLATAESFGAMNQSGTTANIWSADVANGVAAWTLSGLVADLSSATGITINDLRLAVQTQRVLEADQRAGTRYVEALLHRWGTTSPDQRLQRPEFLGGGSSPVNSTAVAQTAPSASTPVDLDVQGGLGAFATTSGAHSFSKSFVEHGVLLGIINVRADITYSQGIERYFLKQTRYEFFYPEMAHIGEQAVTNAEIWADASANDALVFGYINRYDEYRYKPSRLCGLMRPDATGTLASWHVSEDFATLPALGDTFIQANLGTPLDRAILIADEPHFIMDIFFNIRSAQPMPTYGNPGGMDRL